MHLILTLLLSASGSIAQTGVIDVQARTGTPEPLAKSLTDAVLVEARRRLGPKAVLGTDDIQQMLRFVDTRRKLGCLDTNCLVEIGGALGVGKLLVGTLGRFGEDYLFTLRLVDVKASNIVAQGSATVHGEAKLLTAVSLAMSQVYDGAPVASAAVEQSAEAPATARSPGHTLSYVLGGAAVVAAVVAVVGLVSFASWEDYSSWKGQPGNTGLRPIGDATSAVNTSNTWGGVAIGTGIGAVALGTGAAFAW